MIFKGAVGELIDFSIGGGWGSEVSIEKHSRVAVIRGTDIPRVAKRDFSTVPFRFESDRKLTKRLLSPGDIILETAGGSSANGQFTGRTLLATQEILDVLGPTICASFCKKLVLNKEIVNPTYFYYYMQDLYKSGRVAYYDSQSTGISNFQFETFLNNEIVELPEKEIQASIANILSNLQNKINNNSQISMTLESIAQSLFKSWFIDFDPVHAKSRGEKPFGMDDETAALFPDSFEESELGMIPKGWKTNTLSDYEFLIQSGARPKGGVKSIKSGIPSIGAESIAGIGVFDFTKTKYITEEFFKSMRKGIPKDFDILLYKDGGKPGEFKPRVGMYGLGYPFSKFAINEHIFILRSTDLTQPFLYFLINSEATLNILRERGIKAAIPGINQQDVLSIPFVAPPFELIKKFEKVATPIIQEILKLANQSLSLNTLMNSLLPRLISGELQLPEELLVS